CTISFMQQSKLFTKTRKEIPSSGHSRNAELLVRGGFIYQEMAGVYAYLPLGLRVLRSVIQIIREEMNAVGGQELELTALQRKDVWESSGRWSDEVVDDWFKTDLKNGNTLGLGFTHEEPLSFLMKEHISSYKDLPVYVYQFQTKFRNELRAKSGIMRGREFLMKDLYDFSANENEHKEFYEKMKGVYQQVFQRVGIGDRTHMTISSGGSFSKYSYEFQTITEAGEDLILYDDKLDFAINKDDYSEEVLSDFGIEAEDCDLKEYKTVEVGDIYTLGDKFSRAVGLTYKDKSGKDQYVYMGSYGIGVPRLVGTIVEVFADKKGIVWPFSVAPFAFHILSIGKSEEVKKFASELHNTLLERDVEVLWDDRDKSAGEKFADADLIGIPYQIIVSDRGLSGGEVELKDRQSGKTFLINEADILSSVLKIVKNSDYVRKDV
ncbi:MAG: aminoacyl--tRNA ligase-related protein, partial [Candidatus Paceibacterota bacterium]